MRNTWKRIVAFVLTVCMTLSVLPPVVFAVEGQQNGGTAALDQITYDFRLDTLGLKYTNTANEEKAFANANIIALNSAGTAFGATTLLMQEAIANYYTAGTLNWKMHSTTGSHFSIGPQQKVHIYRDFRETGE